MIDKMTMPTTDIDQSLAQIFPIRDGNVHYVDTAITGFLEQIPVPTIVLEAIDNDIGTHKVCFH